MSMKQRVYLSLEVVVFNTDEVKEPRQLASESNGVLYCWKTCGVFNWLEKGLSASDVLGVVVLPRGLPQQIDMPDDEETD